MTTTIDTAFWAYAYMTATAVDPDGTERHGYVDPRWSMTELFDSRNDVRPVATWSRMDGDGLEPIHESVQRWARETLEEWLGAYEDNCDGTYYGQDASPDFTTGTVWTYALHLTATEHANRYPNIRQWDVTLDV